MIDLFYPARRLYRKIHRELLIRKEQKVFIKYVKSHSNHSFYIMGSPVYTNLGDSAICMAQHDFLCSVGIAASNIKEVTFSEFYQHRIILKKTIDSDQILIGMGGGNMGNQWPVEEQIRYDLMEDYPNNSIIIFPQTIFFSESGDLSYTEQRSQLVYSEHADLVLVAREQKSCDIMRHLYPEIKIFLTPDIVLSSTMEQFGAVSQERTGALMCLRSDPEKSVPDENWERLESVLDDLGCEHRRTDMYADVPVTKENRRECVRRKMQEFCGAKLVITDRLHGMVFAAITGTPCIVFSNYNHKVRGTYEWIKYLPYIKYAETVEDAEKYIPELLAMEDCKYDNAPLMPYFEKLKEVVIEKWR